jgi:hypothetical protein
MLAYCTINEKKHDSATFYSRFFVSGAITLSLGLITRDKDKNQYVQAKDLNSNFDALPSNESAFKYTLYVPEVSLGYSPVFVDVGTARVAGTAKVATRVAR